MSIVADIIVTEKERGMPKGVLFDCVMMAVGGVLGGLLGRKLSEKFRAELNNVVGAMAMGIAITLIPGIHTLGPVMLALVLCYVIGYALDFDGHVNNGIFKVTKKVFGENGNIDVDKFSVLIVLMAFGGSGLIGTMTEGLTGDSSLLMGRSICDFITSMIFGTVIGPLSGLVAIPAMVSLLAFQFGASLIMPYMTDPVYANFRASGGMLTLIGSLRMFGVSKAKPMNAVLCVIFIVPITTIWLRIFP